MKKRAADAVRGLAEELLANEGLREQLAADPDPAGRLYRLAREEFFRLLFRDLRASGGRESPVGIDTTGDSRPPLADPGAIYQQLLALQPRLDLPRRTFDLVRVIGTSRKTSGSYYTPACLIELLLRSALDPLITEARNQPDPEAALLRLRICDPSCGSGHFLLAAGHRLARVLASVRGEDEKRALSRIVPACLFGVELDPLAADLCRMALWQACQEPDWLPEDFQPHIKHGNSLVGFQWRLEFPEVFRETGGFDVVLGNPPWERIKFQEKEWLAAHPGASAEALSLARRGASELSRYLRHSGRYPLGARGDLNLYGPFIETSRQLIRQGGRVGLIVPSGLATDESMKDLFQDLLRNDLVSWYDFHNRHGLFPDVQGNVKFGLLTLGHREAAHFETAVQLSSPEDLDEPGRICTLTAEEIARLNPNTLHCPPFTSADDAALVARIHERFSVLVRETEPGSNPWEVRPWTTFHMTKDAPLFHREEALRAEGWTLEGNVFCRGEERLLPLYEAKLIGPFTHRAATFAGVPESVRFRMHARTRPVTGAEEPVLPRYWVVEEAVRSRAGEARWFLGFRNAISAVADSRSLIAAILPRAAVSNGLPLLGVPDARSACLLLALLNSFVLDYVLRQRASGGNLNFHVLKQLPVPLPEVLARPCPWSLGESLADWFVPRVVELVCTSNELADFAGEAGVLRPISLKDERRVQLRAELDAACCHLYGLSDEEMSRILKSFTILEKQEKATHGCFRSAEGIRVCFRGFREVAATAH